MPAYQHKGISPGILTKRGCAFRCTYCPYRALEGPRYRLKSAARVVDEIEQITGLRVRAVFACRANIQRMIGRNCMSTSRRQARRRFQGSVTLPR